MDLDLIEIFGKGLELPNLWIYLRSSRWWIIDMRWRWYPTPIRKSLYLEMDTILETQLGKTGEERCRDTH